MQSLQVQVWSLIKIAHMPELNEIWMLASFWLYNRIGWHLAWESWTAFDFLWPYKPTHQCTPSECHLGQYLSDETWRDLSVWPQPEPSDDKYNDCMLQKTQLSGNRNPHPIYFIRFGNHVCGIIALQKLVLIGLCLTNLLWLRFLEGGRMHMHNLYIFIYIHSLDSLCSHLLGQSVRTSSLLPHKDVYHAQVQFSCTWAKLFKWARERYAELCLSTVGINLTIQKTRLWG